MDCLVALDAGTGSGRCVVYDASGRPLASAREAFHYRPVPDPAMPFARGFDLDPVEFWGVLARCTRQALQALPGGARVRGVAATSQREGCVLLDQSGAVLYAGPNVDARAVLEGMEALQRMSADRLHAITGHVPPHVFPLVRWLWFCKHGDASRIASLLMLSDWITYRLCGARVAEPSNACETMLYDVARRDWSAEILDTFGVPRAILPTLHRAGEAVGTVTADAAAATGLPAGTPVFVGGADTQCALLGSGALQPGDTAAILGSTCPVQTVLDAPRLDPGANLWTCCHVVDGRWVLESNAGDTGGTYRWLLRLFYGGYDAGAHAAAEAAMTEACEPLRPVACFAGPTIFNVRSMNPFRPAGLLFRFPLLHVDRPGVGDLLRGFVENVAFAVRANLEQLAAVTGRPAETLAVSGGMAQGRTLLRVLADTLARPLAVAEVPESASLGCAILTAAGAGLHASVADAVRAMVRTAPFLPDAARVPAHDERYWKWRELYAALEAQTL